VSGRYVSRSAKGFSLIEMLVALTVFLVICGVAFELLTMAMKRFQSESQALGTFQEARFGLDQMVRDINDAGYPPLNQYSSTPPDPTIYAISPIAWSPNYPATTCSIDITCITPGDFDIILETKVTPQDPTAKVKWVRYQLQGTTLYRAIVDKVSGGDPDSATSSELVPYVQNVMNNASAAQIAQFRAVYPLMFPGGAPVPIFSYTCDTSGGPESCPAAGGDNSPDNVRSVAITLIVMAPFPDAQTGQPKLVELRGRGRIINPNY
jgi:prepilin-type N-terminal cleavage/methylation domain-containing protein